jgi:hypothetical protein
VYRLDSEDIMVLGWLVFIVKDVLQAGPVAISKN